MRYTLTINQVGVADAGLIDHTDIIDWHIIDYIHAWIAHPRAHRLGEKVWINLSHLMREMPMLGIRSKSSLSRRLRKLADLSLLELERDQDQRLYCVLTEYCFDVIAFRPANGTPRTVARDEQPLHTDNGTVAHEQRGPLHTSNIQQGIKGTGNNDQEEGAGKPAPRIDDVDYQLAEYMWTRVQEVAPKAKPPNLYRWADTIRLMRQRDGLAPREIAVMFKFANQHEFWRTNILSPDKLRKQFSRLDAEYRNSPAPAQDTGGRSIMDAMIDRSWADAPEVRDYDNDPPEDS